MQASRSNQERTEATRAALITAARRLFVEQGYAATGTPEIVAAAQVTRGALYHHFADKAALFLAVARQTAQEVAERIGHSAPTRRTPLEALLAGAEAYFSAIAEGGRARLLLIEAPAILGAADLHELGRLAGADELRLGLEQALAPRHDAPLDELTAQLSAAFDCAALAIANGASARRHKAALRLLLEGLCRPG